MSKYSELVHNPIKVDVKDGAREVVFTLISAMCDNESTLQFKKHYSGDFRANLLGEAFSNIQAKHDKIDMEWAADDGKWNEVVKMINTGTSRVGSIRAR